MDGRCLPAVCRWWARNMTTVIALGLTVSLMSTGYLAFFDTNNPRVLESETRDEFGNAKSKFRAGEQIYVYRVFCVDRVAAGDVDVEIISSKTNEFWFLGNRASGASKGCTPRTSVNRLPTSIPPGHYQFRATVQYNLNPLRTLTYVLPIVPFEVIP